MPAVETTALLSTRISHEECGRLARGHRGVPPRWLDRLIAPVLKQVQVSKTSLEHRKSCVHAPELRSRKKRRMRSAFLPASPRPTREQERTSILL